MKYMSVTAVHCCKLLEKPYDPHVAPQLLSYCNPVSVRGGETFSRGEYRNIKGLFCFLSFLHSFLLHMLHL